MPTVRQLFALLREDVEQEAIEETRRSCGVDFYSHMDSEDVNIKRALHSSFLFYFSEKGHKYWQDIANNPPLKTQQDA